MSHIVSTTTDGTWGNDEAAHFLGCSPGTLRVWVCKGRVPYVKVGRLTRFLRLDLEDFLQQRRVLPLEAP
jgi:excisionase family DNA binding protein